MSPVLLVLFALAATGYATVYIVYSIKRKKTKAAISTGILSLLALFFCLALALVG